jgi:hypothetical protein
MWQKLPPPSLDATMAPKWAPTLKPSPDRIDNGKAASHRSVLTQSSAGHRAALKASSVLACGSSNRIMAPSPKKLVIIPLEITASLSTES